MPNLIYTKRETPIVFRDSGGDAVITLQNLGFGAGRVSARYDRGAGSKPKLYTVTGIFQYETAPQLGEAVEVYLFQSDGTYVDGNIGTTDAALTSDKRRNGLPILFVVADTTATGTNIIRRAVNVEIVDQYFSVGVWNASTGDNLRNVANTSLLIFTPQPDEVQ